MNTDGAPHSHIDLRVYLAFLTACLVGIGAGILWYMGGDNPYHATVKGAFSAGGTFTAALFLLAKCRCSPSPGSDESVQR